MTSPRLLFDKTWRHQTYLIRSGDSVDTEHVLSLEARMGVVALEGFFVTKYHGYDESPAFVMHALDSREKPLHSDDHCKAAQFPSSAILR